jgi:S1-C subfamily serine protease
MKKYRWLIIMLGLAALGMALVFGAAFGAGLTYFWLQADPVQAAIAAPVNIENDQGLLVSSVDPQSAAAQAGLVRGDIILEVNGEPVNHIVELKEFLAALEPGDVVSLTVLHGDETRTLEARLEDFDGFAYLGVSTCDVGARGKVFQDGPMGDMLIEGFPTGAQIVEVVPDSPAAAAGLQVGDLILSVDQEAVGPQADLADLIQKYGPGDKVTLKVQSEDEQQARQVSVTLGAKPDDPELAYLGVAYQAKMGEFPFMENLPLDQLPEGWQEGGEFFFHGLPFMDGQGMPDHFFSPGDLPDGVEGAIIVSEVLEESPAAQAGLQPGDLIIALDGESVEEVEAFVEAMGAHKPGDEVNLRVVRQGEELEVQATLTAHPDNPEKGFLGVMAGSLQMMKELELPEGYDQDFEFELPGVPGGDA